MDSSHVVSYINPGLHVQFTLLGGGEYFRVCCRYSTPCMLVCAVCKQHACCAVRNQMPLRTKDWFIFGGGIIDHSILYHSDTATSSRIWSGAETPCIFRFRILLFRSLVSLARPAFFLWKLGVNMMCCAIVSCCRKQVETHVSPMKQTRQATSPRSFGVDTCDNFLVLALQLYGVALVAKLLHDSICPGISIKI